MNYHADKNSVMLELEFSNQSSGPISDFNIQINKNAFGVCPDMPISVFAGFEAWNHLPTAWLDK